LLRLFVVVDGFLLADLVVVFEVFFTTAGEAESALSATGLAEFASPETAEFEVVGSSVICALPIITKMNVATSH